MEGDTRGLQDKMRRSYEQPFGTYQDYYLNWVWNKNFLPSAEEIIQGWRERAGTLLKDLVRCWYPKNKAMR